MPSPTTIVLAAALAMLLLASPVRAQQAAGEGGIPPAVVAVLDYQLVLRDSAAAKDIRRQIEGYRKTYQTEIAKEEETLRAEEAALKQQRPLLSQEAFEDRRREFEKRVIEVQRKVQDRTRQLDQAFNQAMVELQGVLVPIVAEMTKTDKFNIVVEKSQVMFAANRLDITQRVIAELDKKLTAVKVPKPQG